MSHYYRSQTSVDKGDRKYTEFVNLFYSRLRQELVNCLQHGHSLCVLLPKYKPLVQDQKIKLKLLSLWINFVQIPRHFSAGSNP